MLRDSAVMGVLLIVHLGIVLALFLTLPYGKFVHGFYRTAALVKYAIETARDPRRRQGRNQLEHRSGCRRTGTDCRKADTTYRRR